MTSVVPDKAPLSFLLSQASKRSSEALLEVLRSRELSIEQWRVLGALSDSDGLTVSRLAEATGMKMPALSKTVDRMVNRALVHRRQDTVDQRRVLVVISDFGVDLLRELEDDVERAELGIAAQLGASGAQRLERLLQAYLKS